MVGKCHYGIIDRCIYLPVPTCHGDEEKQKSGGAFVVDSKSHESTSHYLHDIGESGYCSSIHLLYLQLPHPIHQRSHDYHSNCGNHGYGDVALVEDA